MRALACRLRLLRQTSRALDVRAWWARRAATRVAGLVAKHVSFGVAGGLERALERERRV